MYRALILLAVILLVQGQAPSPAGDASRMVVTPSTSTTANSLSNLTAQVQDVRNWFHSTSANCATNVEPAVTAAAAAGVRTIWLPKNCKYIPISNTTPDNLRIIGEDWATSIIASSSPSTLNLSIGANGELDNVGYNANFCFNAVDPAGAKICQIKSFINASDSASVVGTWPFEATTVLGPVSTPPGASSPNVDMAAIGIIQQSIGGDAIYCSTGDGAAITSQGSACYRMALLGNGDYGLYILPGVQGSRTTQHFGVFVKDLSNNAVGNGIRLDRVGNGTDVSTSLNIIDADSEGATNTRPFFSEGVQNQASGDLNVIFQNTTPFSGTGWHMNLGNGTGTFTGNFIQLDLAGVKKWFIPSTGVVHALAGQITGVEAATNLPAGAITTTQNTKFAVTADANSRTTYQLTVVTAGSAPVRPTTDGTGTATASNCGFIATNQKATVYDIVLTANDITTPANGYSYFMPVAQIARFASVGTTTWQGGSGVQEFTNGATTGVATAITADTTNGCPNIQWTPPTGNTDTWHVMVSFLMDLVL